MAEVVVAEGADAKNDNNEGALITAADAAVGSFEPTLTHIDPVPIKKLIMIVNAFTINTTDFLNKFAVLSERKLSRITQSVQRVTIMLALLEAKLDSIPWLRDGVAPPPVAPAQAQVSNAPAAAPAQGGGPPAPGPPGAAAPAAEPEPEPPAVAVPMVKDDPRYAPFFKMMERGVPKQALTPRVMAEGLDPAYLDTPEAPAPASSGGGQLVRVKNDSDSEEAASDGDFD